MYTGIVSPVGKGKIRRRFLCCRNPAQSRFTHIYIMGSVLVVKGFLIWYNGFDSRPPHNNAANGVRADRFEKVRRM